MREAIPSLSTHNLYHRINSANLASHTKQELFEQLGVLSITEVPKPISSTIENPPPPSYEFDAAKPIPPPPTRALPPLPRVASRDRSGGAYPIPVSPKALTDEDKEVITEIKLPEVNPVKNNEISPFHNFGFDLRFSNGRTYAFDDFCDGEHIIYRVNTEAEKEQKQLEEELQRLEQEHQETQAIIGIFGSPLHDDNVAIDDTFDDIPARISRSTMSQSANSGILNMESITGTLAKKNNCNGSTNKVDIGNIHWIKFNKLVELLTSDNYKMRRITILTHTQFCDSIQLLSALTNRYFMPYPPNLCESELKYWIEKKQQPIRFRVIATIKYWMKEHWKDDFADNKELQQAMLSFCDDIKSEAKTHNIQCMNPCKLAQQIKSMMNKQSQKDLVMREKMKQREKSLSSDHGNLNAKHDDNFNYILLTSNNIQILSNCITELCLTVFMSIKPRECVNKAWSDSTKAPNLYYMTLQHELIVAFVQESLLNEKDLNKRAVILDIFIRISHTLSIDGNFHGSHAIYSAINMSQIYRLKQTFSLINKNTNKKLMDLKHLFNYRNNRMNLRNKIQEYLAQECIPDLSILRRDLTFVEDGNKSVDKDNGNLINFFKCQLLAKIIEQIKMHQNANMQNINELSSQMTIMDLEGLSTSQINPVAFEYIRIKIEKWKRVFQVDGDKKVWERFRKMSQELE